MAPERKRETEEDRAVERAGDRLAGEADRMEQSSEELGAQIDQTRSDWERKRADDDVPGAPPRESQKPANEAAYPERYQDENRDAENQDENGSSDTAEDDANPSA